jgi:hypothetical protein
MDPLVTARYADRRQSAAYLITISATPTRRYTNYPGGLTVSAQTYIFRPFTIGSVVETSDGAAVRLTVTFNNADNLLNDLVNDPAQRRKDVVVTKLHFNADFSIAGTEPWLEGFTAKPRLIGAHMELTCRSDDGREGPSPDITYGDVLTAHEAPPSSNQFLFGGGV